MSLRRKAIKASSDEQLITLVKPLKVSGGVTDADTGRPIDTFTVLPGIDWGNGRSPYWERQSARKESGGRFEVDFTEPRAGHLIRIEAEGYLPASSRSFTDSEGEVRFDFALKKGEGVSGVVLGLDAQPLAGASVCLVVPGTSTQLVNGRPPDRRDTPVVETGRDGRFRFPAQEGKFTLVVLYDSGFAMRTESQVAASPDVKLEAWGKVEGYVRIGARPAAGEAVHLNVHQEGRSDEPRPYFNYETTADASGHYVIERVPPGKVYVAREIKLSDRSTGYSHTTPAEVKAGQTARVDIGGTGRPVVGRVIAPGGAKVDWSVGFHSLRPAQPKLDIPKDLSPEQKARWYEEWSHTPEGKAYQERSQRNYCVKVEGDGSFRVDDVPAGEYDLNIAVNEPLPGNQCGIGGDLLGSVTHKVNVPEMPGGRSDEPLDVGTLELAMARRIKVGDTAPGFQVATLGGESLKLEDLHGKFVLLDFWATWCGPCVAETPHLKAAHEAFGKDDRFAMIGLSLDPEKDAPRQYVEKNSLGWHQAFLGDFSEAKLPGEYGVRGIPSIWLIGPDGKVIAKDLRGAAIKDTIARALGESR
jgi:thiol-disulfide isomerase/thioredoxin